MRSSRSCARGPGDVVGPGPEQRRGWLVMAVAACWDVRSGFESQAQVTCLMKEAEGNGQTPRVAKLKNDNGR